MLQSEIERESRLYDEPIGPEPAEGAADGQDHYESRDIDVGDVLVWDEGVETEIVAINEARQPPLAYEGELGAGDYDLILYETEEGVSYNASWLVGEMIALGEMEIDQ